MPGQPQRVGGDIRPRLHQHGVAPAQRRGGGDLGIGPSPPGIRAQEQEAVAGGAQRLPRQAQHAGQGLLRRAGRKLVDAGARHLPRHRHHPAHRRHHHALALPQRQVRRGAGAGDGAVEIDDPRPARPLDPDGAERAGAAHPARQAERVEHAGQRRQGLQAGAQHLPGHEDGDLPRLAEGDIGLRPAQLPRHPRLDLGAQLAQAAAGGGDGGEVGQGQHPVPSHPQGVGGPHPAPHGDDHLVVAAEEVAVRHRARGQAGHRRLAEAVIAELAQRRLLLRQAGGEEALGVGERLGRRRHGGEGPTGEGAGRGRGHRGGGGGRRQGCRGRKGGGAAPRGSVEQALHQIPLSPARQPA